MSTTIDIPGGTASIRDVLEAEEDFQILEAGAIAAAAAMFKLAKVDLADEQAALANAHLTDEEALGMIQFQNAAIVAFLESWTLKKPLPTLQTVRRLDRPTYRALAEASAPLARTTVLGTDFAPGEDENGRLVEDGPFGGSLSSSSPPGESPQSPSTDEQPASTESTDSAAPSEG